MVAEALGNGTPAEHLDDVLDRLLGTALAPRDQEMEQVWQDEAQGLSPSTKRARRRG